MFKKDIDLVKNLHERYKFQTILLDAGGVENPVIADYEISIEKAIHTVLEDGRQITFPHAIQNDRYVAIRRPWNFIDETYIILNPEYGDPAIEELPFRYSNYFSTVITTSVLEHVVNPYEVSDALFKIIKPGGFLITTAPFVFPYHVTATGEDNFRFSPLALRRIHEKSGFKWLEGDFYVNYSSDKGIGCPGLGGSIMPQTIIASYALCLKEK